MIKNFIKIFLRNLYGRLSPNQIEFPPSGKYSIRNCEKIFICPMTGNIDHKIEIKQFHPNTLDKDFMFEAASCSLCSRNIQVQNNWEQIQKSLFLNTPFIVNKIDIEPLLFMESRSQMLSNIDKPLPQPLLVKKKNDVVESLNHTESLEKIRTALIESHSGDSYGSQRKAAELAVKFFGKEWILKSPPNLAAEKVRNDLRMIVKETTPKWHTNHYVIWQRLQNYGNNL
jgi:hypothetical protein